MSKLLKLTESNRFKSNFTHKTTQTNANEIMFDSFGRPRVQSKAPKIWVRLVFSWQMFGQREFRISDQIIG